MTTRNFARYSVMLTMLGLLAACHGGSDGNGGGDNAKSATAVIGPAGGTLAGPDGVQVEVPPGAFDEPTTIGIKLSSAGAPTSFPDDITPAGPIYEFTPHDVTFKAPITIRMPVPANATGAGVLMASPGGEWQMQEATVTGQVAEWQRNSFSWGFYGWGCHPSNRAPYSDTNPDPHPCWPGPSGGTNASATPAEAITRTSFAWPSSYTGTAGSWTVNQASIVHLTVNYSAVPDCENPRVKVIRVKTALPLHAPDRVQTLFDGPVTITPTTFSLPGVGTYVKAIGSTAIDVPFSHLDNGTTGFGSSFSCNRPSRPTRTGGDWATFVASIPVPSVTHTIGGTVSGLTGSGLVLQNNGGDDLSVSGNGGFTFATPIAADAPYAVSVQTQPTGQTCTVLNGAGSAGSIVTNVAVSCTALASFTVGGTVSGLTGSGLVLQNNGGDNLSVSGDGVFTFATAIATGAPYDVSVQTQPGGQTCAVQSGSGTAQANVANVAVTCATPSNWSAAVAISAVGKNASQPALGASADGYATLAWVQHDTDQYNGYASRFDPAANSWQGGALIENLDTDTAQSLSGGVYSPRVAMATSQRAQIAFGYSVQPTSYQIGMSRYTGSGWESQILTVGGNSNDHALSFTGDGNTPLIMYSQYDGLSKYAIRSQAYRYADNTLATLSPDGGVTSGSSSASAASALGSSDAVGTWLNRNQFVYVNRFNSVTQTWGVPVNLNTASTGNAYPPALASNAAGNAAVVWLDLNGGYSVYASRLSGGTWSAPVTLATQAEGRPQNFDSDSASVATGLDASGNAYFAWGQEDLASPYTIRLYVRRCAIGQAMSACESRVPMDSRNDRIGKPSLAVAPNGDVWVAWVARTAAGSEIRIRRRDAAGWGAVVAVGSSSDTNTAPAIAIDGQNRVTVAWEGADRRIYVARHQ